MSSTIHKGFNILKLIDSQTRDADLREGKQERGLTEMIRQACPISASRAGVPLPTTELLRDLQLTTGSLSGQNAAGVVLNPLERLAGAARPALVLEQAGVEVLNINDGQEGNIPRWRGNGGGWIQEGQTLAESNLTLSNVNVRARHCGAQVTFSRRLRLGTEGDIQEMIITEMRRVVQQALEDGLIDGDGEQGKPLGLIQQGTNTVTFAGSSPTYPELTAMLEDLTDADGDPGSASWLMHPSTAAALFRTEKASNTGLFVLEASGLRQWSCLGLPVLVSTFVPETKVVLMDPRAAKVCYFGPPQLIVDPFSGGKSINGSSNVIVSNYVDIAVPEPALVVVGSS